MALCVRPEQRQDQERFDRCAAEFISLMSVKETEPKKTLCAQSTPGYSLMKGFFERASCPRRKTAHIHVRRPPGLQTCGNAVGSLDAKATATATAIAPTATAAGRGWLRRPADWRRMCR